MHPAFLKLRDVIDKPDIIKKRNTVVVGVPGQPNPDIVIQKGLSSQTMALMQVEFLMNGKYNQITLSQFEEFILKGFAQTLSLKMQSLVLLSHSQRNRDEIVGIMRLTSELMASKTFQFLIYQVRIQFPSFFGFQTACLLLKDPNANQLLTSQVDSPHPLADRKEDYIFCPSIMGMTGLAIKHQEIQYSNYIHKEQRFNGSVDNQACIIDPYNVMICPIVKYHQTKQNHADSEQSGEILGVIQLMNKNDRAHIIDDDILKFRAINNLLVVAIHSVEEMRTFLDITMEQSSSIGKQRAQVNDMQKMNEQNKVIFNGLTASMHNLSHELRVKKSDLVE
ncbi:hypothetical protein FGO68_gene17114 [Halteria grandinella]|uniref:GAF domain-containing protein n=1 Tax=Halteria grandinella TaxID=5974 RepID=A0A8J8SWB0_HALGN|nr:hypothetical protein FGO68_gene17114 [Halteria grandinella]